MDKTEQVDKTKQAQQSERYSPRKLGKPILYVLLVVVALFIVKAKFLTPPEVPVVSVKRQDMAAEVQGTGTVTVDIQANVGAKIPGRIERVFVNEHDFARKGQIIAELEDTDIRRELQRAQARLEAARATVQARRATVQARRANEWQTGRAWDREKHLVATGAVSQEEADQYEQQYRTAARAVGAAEADVGAAEADVGAAQAQVGAAEADVRLQEFNLSQTKIFTYLSGVVTKRPKRPGEAVVAGEPVVTIADPSVTTVDAYVDQRLSGKIRAGQPATVLLRGREDEPIRGRVYRVSPQADPATEEMTVEVAFPLSPKALILGQWADVYIQVAEVKDVLVVPKAAVMQMGSDRMVLVVGSDHKVRQVVVEPLASSPRLPITAVKAVKGDLKPGDWVIAEPVGVQPGQKVRTTPKSNPGAMAPMPM